MAALTKLSGLALLPVTVAAAVICAWRTRSARSLLLTGLSTLVAAGAAGWWYLRNYLLYGDWVALSRHIDLRPDGYSISSPGSGPTLFWKPGAMIRDTYPLTIDSNAAATSYTVTVVLTDLKAQKRLVLPDGNNSVALQQVTVETP